MALFARAAAPARLVTRVYERQFEEIPVDPAWVRTVRAASERGSVVHVARNVSLLDLLALEHLLRRFELPRLGFANELGGWVEPPFARVSLSLSAFARRPAAAPSETDRLLTALDAGRSALLFIKRPPSMLDRAKGARSSLAPSHARREGDELLAALLEEQRRGRREVVLVPQTLVWTQRPEQRGFSLVDTLFGPAEFPGDLRAAGQFLANHKNCVVRAGEPVALRELLAQEAATDPLILPRRLAFALLRKVERERRAVLGPARKPADRVREEVLRSPRLQAVLRDLAGPGEGERAVLEQKARGMLRELEAMPDAQTLKGLEIAAETLASRVYAGIDVDLEGLERLRDAARRGTLVLLPSHKSHVDYLLLTFVLRKHALQLPVIAAGDNLAFFPLGPVFRRAGAFFIRRSFKGDRLYTAVVDAYVRRLMRDGQALEFFLEGARSRTGKLLPPKLGLLNMVVDACLGLEGRTISFVPISIGYERMMEAGAYARELSGGEKRPEDLTALLGLGDVLREKYGRANVQFGQIVELSELRARLGLAGPLVSPAKRRALVNRLAHQVMSEINRVTSVTPGSLVALALLSHRRRGLPHAELVAQCGRLTKLVRRLGARTAPSLTRSGGELREVAVREAALLHVRGGLVHQHVPGDTLTSAASKRRARIYTGDDVIYSVPDDQRLVLDFAKNTIVHLFVDRALISVALLSAAAEGSSLGVLRERVQSLSRLFKYEFMFRTDAPFDAIFDETVADLTAQGALVAQGDAIGVGPGSDGLDGRGWVLFYASVIRNFLESYRVAARAARVLVRGPVAERELAERALRVGEQMFLGGEIERSEAVSQPALEHAFSAFLEQGYLTRAAGKLALAPSFASDEAARAIEGRVTRFLAWGD